MGAMLAHAMFGLTLMQTSKHVRSSLGEGIGEVVATFVLLFTILGTVRRNAYLTAFTVPAAIAAGYWFTSSTSFANPAITIARSITGFIFWNCAREHRTLRSSAVCGCAHGLAAGVVALERSSTHIACFG